MVGRSCPVSQRSTMVTLTPISVAARAVSRPADSRAHLSTSGVTGIRSDAGIGLRPCYGNGKSATTGESGSPCSQSRTGRGEKRGIRYVAKWQLIVAALEAGAPPKWQ
jgi:hypothetical protein